MSKLQRKSAKLFAEDAAADVGGIGQFGSLAAGNVNYSKDPDVIQALTAFKNGWSSAVTGNKSPSIEDRNALDYLLSYQQAYIMQRGVPEWISTETYYQGSFVSKADGKMYVSTIDDNTGNDPETDTVNWIAFPTPAEVSAKVAKAGDTMTGDLTISKSNAALTLTNSDSVSYSVQCNDNGNLDIKKGTQGIYLKNEDSCRPYYITGSSTYRLLDIRDVSSLGPRMNSGVSIANNATIPVTALVVAQGTVSNYQIGILRIDGVDVCASPNNEGSGRFHCVSCIVRAGAKVTYVNLSSARYYPLG